MEIDDIEVTISGTIYVSGEIPLSEFIDYGQDEEDYIVNNLDSLEHDFQDCEHSLNVVDSEYLHEVKIKLNNSLRNANTLAETVISLNAQVEKLQKHLSAWEMTHGKKLLKIEDDEE